MSGLPVTTAGMVGVTYGLGARGQCRRTRALAGLRIPGFTAEITGYSGKAAGANRSSGQPVCVTRLP
jgi:hypothetical protein